MTRCSFVQERPRSNPITPHKKTIKYDIITWYPTKIKETSLEIQTQVYKKVKDDVNKKGSFLDQVQVQHLPKP